MPEIPDSCEFDIAADQIEFKTKTNSDYIEFKNVEMSQDAAATLAWLINTDNHLTVEISIKGE